MSRTSKTAIELTASSDFGTAGKQYIGLVTGPDRKYGCALEFVGRRSGKRNDFSCETVIAPGLYKVRNTTRKGTDDTYWLIWDLDGTLIRTVLVEEDARRLAADLSPTNIAKMGRRVEISDTEVSLAESATKDPMGEVEVSANSAVELGCEAGKMPRHQVIALRRAFVDRMRGVVTPELPIEAGERPSDAVYYRAKLETQIASLRAQLAHAEAELSALT